MSSTVPTAFSQISIRYTGTSHESGSPVTHLILLIFEAVMEVVFVSLPGYILARQGLFNAENQKFLANLNVALFTPCLSEKQFCDYLLTANKLLDLAVIPVIFIIQTAFAYMGSVAVSKLMRLEKRPANFVTAMGIFGNSNSLPISLVVSLSQTLKGLHWDKVPDDTDEQVAARGILYLLIFQQLGQLLRWSWGYHVLLAPPEKFEEPHVDVEQGDYRDSPDLIPTLHENSDITRHNSSSASFRSGDRTPVTRVICSGPNSSEDDPIKQPKPYPVNMEGKSMFNNYNNEDITSFPSIRTPSPREDRPIVSGIKKIVPWTKLYIHRFIGGFKRKMSSISTAIVGYLPKPVHNFLVKAGNVISRFCAGTWDFMNPPLWAMLVAVIVASIPFLQNLFFAKGSFIANSLTRAVAQSGGVAVPLILVVLGANLARNTLPASSRDSNSEENQIAKRLLIASLISRMVLPTLIMAPLLAVMAKFIPISIVADPIFLIVCFLLTGAPSALQLAQICQINGVYEGVMSKLLFQSYVIWILPSTLILVMIALEVVKWAGISTLN
ncbi:Auxin Efflux Carrier superfamily [Blumeria hordei DH14]|uniref:Auxin Efflux Carrier superfamily n=1 Tax=Blumeria graminis f. sp. hordei (strain DH14) TaxID=546991 RepID=N1J6I4_BLUG1|nr:Auxin Efflux Carrier superfamily [Blumeria hordei DH14]